MSSLTELYPQPVRITIGDTSYTVSQLRVKDIAVLQSFLEKMMPHPFQVRREELLAAEGEDRERLLLQIRRADHTYPVVFGTDDADRIFNSVGGLAYLLLVVLGRHQEIDLEHCLSMATTMTSQEIVEFQVVVYGISPRDRLYSLLSPPKPKRSPDGVLRAPVDSWGERIDEVCRSHHLTYDQVGEMTLSQFRMARSGGKVQPARLPAEKLTHEQITDRVRRERELLGLEN